MVYQETLSLVPEGVVYDLSAACLKRSLRESTLASLLRIGEIMEYLSSAIYCLAFSVLIHDLLHLTIK